MKKIVGLILLIISFTLSALTGCGSPQIFEQKNYISDSKNIDSVYIDVIDREITVTGSPDNSIYIDYHESAEEYYDFSIEQNTLIIKYASNKDWTDFIGKKPAAKHRKISVRLPDSLMSSLYISTTNENITLESLTFSDKCVLSSNGGNIGLGNIGVGKTLDLNCKNGNITGSVIGTWDEFTIKCDIKKGNSNLPAEKSGGEKLLKTVCNNGDVNISFVQNGN